MDEHKSIHAALVAAQQEIGAAAKDSTNAFHRYKYVSADQMIEHCRTALANNGVLVMQGSVERIGEGGGTDWLRFHYVAVHGASGTSIEWHQDLPAVPEKGRPIDKATCGAMTVSLSYAIRGLLLVPREDENEPDRRDDTKHVPPSRSAPASAAATAKPAAAPAKPKSEHWQPYSDGKNHTKDNVLTVTGAVEKITSKETAKGGNRYGFKIGEDWFNSFSDSAKDCVTEAGKGTILDIGYTESQYGKDIVSIDRPQKAAPFIADDQIPF